MKSLIAFAATPLTEKLNIHAGFKPLSATELELEFHFKGDLSQIHWPKKQSAERTEELWKTTCLEAFFSSQAESSAPYLEINLSPGGPWNAYDFSGYRENMRIAPNIIVRLKQANITDSDAYFLIQVLSSDEIPTSFFGLTVVLESTNHEKSYWALRHSQKVPDFHAKTDWERLATR